jgi:hypothetical protein
MIKQFLPSKAWLMTLLLGPLFLLGAGCISLPTDPIGSAEMKQRALSFTPPSDRAGVYVIRPGHFIWCAVRYEVDLNNQKFGSLMGDSYLYGVIPPGKYVLRYPNGDKSEAEFIAESGKNYFFKVERGFLTLPGVDQISESEGIELVRKFKLSGDNQLDNTSLTRYSQ